MSQVTALFDIANKMIDFVIPGVLGLILAGVWIYFTISGLRREGMGKGVFLAIELFLVEAIFFLIIWSLPEFIAHGFEDKISPAALRWFMLYSIGPTAVFFLTRKHGGRRGLFASFGHLTILLCGWLLGRWMGILFFSMPVITIIYWFVFWLAQAILPYAEPENKVERSLKFQFLAWYSWGLNFPIWAVKDPTEHEAEKRVDGDFFKNFGLPGLVITYAHQATGISTGIEFNRVDGPGVIFTHPYQQPFGIVDLRTQLRSQPVSAVLSNGIQVEVILFASFAIDRRDWSSFNRNRLHDIYRTTPLFRKNLMLDRQIGSYPYSSARIHTALGTTGINAPAATQQSIQEKEKQAEDDKEEKEKPLKTEESKIYWDDWVMIQLERTAKAVLSQRSLDELWIPKNDDSGINALDEIGQEIFSAVNATLQGAGIQLFSARIVNFNITEDSEIAARQFLSWKSIWDQKATDTLSEAQAESDGMLERARAQAKSMLLNAIAESLERARAINQDLPRHLVVLNYLTALEQFILHNPGGMDEKVKARIDAWKETLMLPNSED